jgi:hypothetical protein
MNKSPEKQRTPVKPPTLSPESPDKSELDTVRLRETTVGIRSPLRQQVETLYREKRETYQKLLTEIAGKKSLEKEIKYLEAKYLRYAYYIPI